MIVSSRFASRTDGSPRPPGFYADEGGGMKLIRPWNDLYYSILFNKKSVLSRFCPANLHFVQISKNTPAQNLHPLIYKASQAFFRQKMTKNPEILSSKFEDRSLRKTLINQGFQKILSSKSHFVQQILRPLYKELYFSLSLYTGMIPINFSLYIDMIFCWTFFIFFSI